MPRTPEFVGRLVRSLDKGRVARKHRFALLPQQLVIEINEHWTPDQIVLVCRHRNRQYRSKERHLESSCTIGGRRIVVWPDTMADPIEFVTTLYTNRKHDDHLDEKDWTLTVEGAMTRTKRGTSSRSKSRTRQQCRPLASIELNICQLIGPADCDAEMRLQLKPLHDGVESCALNLIAKCEPLDSADSKYSPHSYHLHTPNDSELLASSTPHQECRTQVSVETNVNRQLSDPVTCETAEVRHQPKPWHDGVESCALDMVAANREQLDSTDRKYSPPPHSYRLHALNDPQQLLFGSPSSNNTCTVQQDDSPAMVADAESGSEQGEEDVLATTALSLFSTSATARVPPSHHHVPNNRFSSPPPPIAHDGHADGGVALIPRARTAPTSRIAAANAMAGPATAAVYGASVSTPRSTAPSSRNAMTGPAAVYGISHQSEQQNGFNSMSPSSQADAADQVRAAAASLADTHSKKARELADQLAKCVHHIKDIEQQDAFLGERMHDMERGSDAETELISHHLQLMGEKEQWSRRQDILNAQLDLNETEFKIAHLRTMLANNSASGGGFSSPNLAAMVAAARDPQRRNSNTMLLELKELMDHKNDLILQIGDLEAEEEEGEQHSRQTLERSMRFVRAQPGDQSSVSASRRIFNWMEKQLRTTPVSSPAHQPQQRND